MKVKFDSLNRFEVPKLYVCNPGATYENGVLSKVIGCLSDTTDEEMILNFNAISELNFRAYRVKRTDPEESNYTFNLYKSLQNRRLIFLEDVGFFVITQVVDGYSDGLTYKDIRAESCEIEIAQKSLTYIENGTYAFTDIFEKIVATLPLWKIGSIADKIAEKYRTFEDVSSEINTLAFLVGQIQDAYECIVQFDTINRLIHVYDQENFVEQTPIHITKNDVINSIDITENSDDLYTAISILGDNDLNIAAVNPLGTNVIYNFDYYLSWMSKGLRQKVVAWNQLVIDKEDEYSNLNLEYYECLTEQSNLQSELDALNEQLTMYQRMRDNIVAEGDTGNVNEYNEVIEDSGGSPISISEDVEETLAEIDDKIAMTQDKYTDTESSLRSTSSRVDALSASIKVIHEEVAIKEYFSSDEYAELYNYIFEGSLRDEFITVTSVMTQSEKFKQMQLLYDRAKKKLERVSTPTQEFSIDVENFLFQREFEEWSELLTTGCLINVELDLNDVAPLFLSNITINYSDRTLLLTFGNRFCKFDPKSIFDNVLGDIKKTANTIDYIKEILYPIKNGEFNAMREALQRSRDLTMGAALSSTNEEVVIDGSGYTGRRMLDSGEYDPRQIKITGRSIVFTDDSWESCKVALGEIILDDDQTTYGINAETLIGDVIIGNNLRILDDDGNDLLTVVDDMIKGEVSETKENVLKLTQMIQDENGIEMRISEIEKSLDSPVTEVTTTTGYTFNAEGLTIYKSGEEIENRLDNTGMYVFRGNDPILVANNMGVEAINLTSSQYLIVGENSRFENYTKEAEDGTIMNRTGCFYIGE